MYSNGCMYPEGKWCRVTEATGGPEINQSQRVYCRIYWCVCRRSRALSSFTGSPDLESLVATAKRDSRLPSSRHLPLSFTHALALSILSPFAPRAVTVIVELIAHAINNSLSLSLSRSLARFLS